MVTTSTNLKRVAILASGSNAPGKLDVIKVLSHLFLKRKIEVIAINHGFDGLLNKSIISVDTLTSGESREFALPKGLQLARKNLQELEVDLLIGVGGSGTQRGLWEIAQNANLGCLGIPATVENDIYACERSLGFDSAVAVAVSALDRLSATSGEVYAIELAGRETGALAIEVGLAVKAQSITFPEHPESVDDITRQIKKFLLDKPALPFILLATQGKKDGRIFDLAELIRKKTAVEMKVVVLSHLQRNGEACASDRTLSVKLAAKCLEFALGGKRDVMVTLQNNRFLAVPLQTVVNEEKRPALGLIKLIKELSI